MMGERETRLMLERAIVRHCAPTLLGAKPAGMFTCSGACAAAGERCVPPACGIERAVSSCDADLAPRGIRITVLAWRPYGAIIYVYRPDLLARSLADARVARALRACGYGVPDAPYDAAMVRSVLMHLSRRFADGVPHEVGFFLGYPFEDVAGFIEHQGRGYICAGCWKVYSNARDAMRRFARYKRCLRRCWARYQAGATLSELAALPGRVVPPAPEVPAALSA